MGGLVNENFEVQEDEDTTMIDNGFSFRCALEDTTQLEDTRIRKMEEAPMMVDKNKMVVLENNTSTDRPVVAAHQRKYWTKEEHKLVDTYILPCHVVLVVLYLKSTYDN